MNRKTPIISLMALILIAAPVLANKNDLNRDRRISWEEFEIMKQAEAKKNSREYNEQQSRYLFEDKDRDGDGALSYEELAKNPVDLNDDKKISYEEFVRMHQKRAERTGREPNGAWMQSRFQKLDKDQSGYLTYQELAAPVE